MLSAVAVGVVAVGFLIALWRYLGRPVPETAPTDVSVLTVAARRDLYGDAFNEDVLCDRVRNSRTRWWNSTTRA